MSQNPRIVLVVLAVIVGLCPLGAPLPAGAAQQGQGLPPHGASVIAPPANLRPVQSQADCATALTLLAAICDAAITAGDLQLIWGESNKSVTGYKVYRVDGGGHSLLGAATGTARYYLVNKPSGGYAGMCFAVQANVGSETSPDSSHYCYGPGGTITTLSLTPSRMGTRVTWSVSAYLGCTNVNASPASAFFKAVDSEFGSAFTAFFPGLLNNKGGVVDGVYAGNELATWTSRESCKEKGTGPYTYAEINAFAGVLFNLGALTNHKLYSATLTFKPLQTVRFAHGKYTVSSGISCQASVGVPTAYLSASGPAIPSAAYATAPPIPVAASMNVTSMVAFWIQYKFNEGFLVSTPAPPYWRSSYVTPTGKSACLTKFSSPSLKLVYF